jgi:hypothetical protein
MFHQELCLHHGTNDKAIEEDRTLYLDHRMSRSLDKITWRYMETLILIPQNWQLEFHVHTNASLLVVGVMLAHNPTSKYDQPIVYAFRLLNKTKQNYIITKKEALTVVYALHKFRHFLLGNRFIFYIHGSCIFGQQTTCV